VGRLEVKEKRVDRLPELLRLAGAQGVRAEWHVLGNGPRRAWLQRAVSGLAPTVFHGWLEGDAYWRALAALDVVVSLSDSEGGPIALLEAMAAGVLPLYPRIGGLAEEPASRVDARCLYPPGDLAAAARQLAALLAADRTDMRLRARAAVAAYTPLAYETAYAAAVQAALAKPRISLETSTRRAAWSDWLPLAVVRRVYETALWR
jgi:glycosyltransferase involved in cell wall biosynthesis